MIQPLTRLKKKKIETTINMKLSNLFARTKGRAIKVLGTQILTLSSKIGSARYTMRLNQLTFYSIYLSSIAIPVPGRLIQGLLPGALQPRQRLVRCLFQKQR